MSAPAVLCEDVCFAYGDEEVLHNVSLRIEPCEMVAIVGPNGGGKTTLLRLILGLLTPSRGRIFVFGRPPVEVRRRIGYVPQHLRFDPRFPVNVLDVVLMGRVDRRPFGPYRRSDRDAARTALEAVEMVDFSKRAFATLSGGERQRVLIAQALVAGADLLLMDEPTANVDPAVEARLFELFHRLNEERTIVFVSHNLHAVTRHVRRVICVNRTATSHPIEHFRTGTSEIGAFTILSHDRECPVIDPSIGLGTPHRAGDPHE